MLTLQDSSALSRLSLPAGSVRIRNQRYAAYLFEHANQVKYCGLEGGKAGLEWLVEASDAGQHLKNCSTGHYLTIEHQLPHVESIPVAAKLPGACWQLERVEPDTYVIRSAWRTWQLLQIGVLDGYLQYGGTVIDPQAARWKLETA